MKKKSIQAIIIAGLLLVLCYLFSLLSGGSRFSLDSVVNKSDLHVLQSAANDIESIRKWSPRFASDEQLQLLAEQIKNPGQGTGSQVNGSLSSLRLAKMTGTSHRVENEVIDYHNTLIRVLEESGDMPKLNELAKKSQAEIKNTLKQITDRAIEKRKLQFIENRLTVRVIKTAESSRTEAPEIERVLQRNHLPAYPRHSESIYSWITGTSWSAPKQWTDAFLTSVKKDISPVFAWHSQTQRCDQLSLSSNAENSLKLRLINANDDNASFFQEAWSVKGNYAVMYCSKAGEHLLEEYDTGMRLYNLTFIPEESGRVAVPRGALRRTGYTSSGKQISFSWLPKDLCLSGEKAADFFHAMGVPEALDVNIEDFRYEDPEKKLIVRYNLTHRFLTKWKSETFELVLGDVCPPVQTLRNELQVRIPAIRQSLWEKALPKKIQLFGLNWQTGGQDATAFRAVMETQLKNQLPVTADLYLTERCDLVAVARNTAEIQSEVLKQLIADYSKLEYLACFLNLKEIHLTEAESVLSGRLEGQPVLIQPEPIAIPFVINRDGTIVFTDTNELIRLCNLETKALKEQIESVPEAADTSEELAATIKQVLESQYPAMVPLTEIRTGAIDSRLWYSMTFRINDYPPLTTEPYFVAGLENAQNQLTPGSEGNPIDRLPEIAVEQWPEIIEHPRLGKIGAEITNWTPQTQPGSSLGGIVTTFVFLGQSTPIRWTEDILVQNNSQWSVIDEASIYNQSVSQFGNVISLAEKFIMEDTGFTAAITQPEQTDNVLDLVRLYPFRFSCMAKVESPMGIPIQLAAGKIWVYSDGITYPQKFSLASDSTLWMKFAGISRPRFDIDLEEKSLELGASFTPPIPDMEALFNQMLEDDSEDGTEDDSEYVTENNTEDGYPDLSEIEPVEMDPEKHQQLFGDTINSGDGTFDSYNPWLGLLQLDFELGGNMTRKTCYGDGDIQFCDFSAIGATGELGPQSLFGQIRTSSLEEVEVDDETVLQPLHLNGSFQCSRDNVGGEIGTNWLGFSGKGGLQCNYPEGEQIQYGVSTQFPMPIVLPHIMDVSGSSSPDMEHYSGSATGLLPHPFIRITGAPAYRFTLWRNDPTDSGFKLTFEWIYPDGRRGSFEKEFPHASVVNQEELLKELEQEIELQADSNNPQSQPQQVSEELAQRLEQIADTYPELEKNTEQESTNKWKETVDYKANSQSKITSFFSSIMEPEKKKESEVPTIVGNVDVEEKNGMVYFTKMPEKKELFVLPKADMKWVGSVDSYASQICCEQDGSGLIISVDKNEYESTGKPTFRQIFCSDKNTVSKSVINQDSEWNRANPMVPFDGNWNPIHNNINAFHAAWDYLFYYSFNQYYHCSEHLNRIDNVCYYSLNSDRVDSSGVTVGFFASQDYIQRLVLIPNFLVPQQSDHAVILKHLSTSDSHEKCLRQIVVASCNDGNSFMSIGNTIDQIKSDPDQVSLLIFADGQEKTGKLNIKHIVSLKSSAPQLKWLLNEYLRNPAILGAHEPLCYVGSSGVAIVSTDTAGTRRLTLMPQSMIRDAVIADSEIAGSEIAAPEIAGSEIAAPEIAGSEIAAPETAGPAIAGPESVHNPVSLCHDDWIHLGLSQTQYLPDGLKTEKQRAELSLNDLAELAVKKWLRPAMRKLDTADGSAPESDTSKDNWYVSPMGLLYDSVEPQAEMETETINN